MFFVSLNYNSNGAILNQPKKMEIDVSKATKLSRQKELNMLNKLNGIKQTQKELKALSLITLNKLINEGYDKAYGKPIVGKWL